jgi:hypothetical protein
MGRIGSQGLARDAGGKPGAAFPHPAVDHDDLGLVQSKVMNVIDSKSLARDAGGKPGATFPHPALAWASGMPGAVWRRRDLRELWGRAKLASFLLLGLFVPGPPALAQDTASTVELPEIDVAAGNDGDAATSAAPSLAASEMVFSGKAVNEQIFARPAEALEIVPGLFVTQHSGEGHAPLYFLRGFSLDHGTDLAIFIDGMPLNQPTHAHGQGYADSNFLIPELIRSVDVKKGPYFAEEGDFSSVGAIHINLVDSFDGQLVKAALGSFNYLRMLGIGHVTLGEGSLLIAGEIGRYDGPWRVPDEVRKLNGLIRYSQGTPENGFSLTGMAYSNRWTATDQIPLRAVTSGQLGLYGSLDPSDGGEVSRYSLSGRWAMTQDNAATAVNFYVIKSALDLWGNFTYFLNDPVNGDQTLQSDHRMTTGLNASHRIKGTFGDLPTETAFGIQTRLDSINLGLSNTLQRRYLSTIRDDKVWEGSASLYAETTLFLTDWFKTNFGWRGDFFTASVASSNPVNSGAPMAFKASPKASLVFGPFERTEYFLNLGAGFHSNDARAVTIKVDPFDPSIPAPSSPFLIPTQGAEAGFRTRAIEGLDSSVSLFILDSASEILFQGDVGATVPSRPSRRIGVEITNHYRPASWLELGADLAYTYARFRGYDWQQAEVFDSLAGFPEAQIGNAPGNYIPGAPALIASAGFTLGEATGWFAGLRYRYFGTRPLTEDNAFRSPALGLLNAAFGYRFDNGWLIQLDGFNLTNSRSDQVSFAYGSFLRSDSLFNACYPASGPSSVPGAVCANGVMDRVLHPVEPLAVRMTIAGRF